MSCEFQITLLPTSSECLDHSCKTIPECSNTNEAGENEHILRQAAPERSKSRKRWRLYAACTRSWPDQTGICRQVHSISHTQLGSTTATMADNLIGTWESVSAENVDAFLDAVGEFVFPLVAEFALVN